MSSYSQRVRDNLLPLSIIKTLPEAFTEWRFTGAVIDHEEPTANCQLCDKEELRYHFLIRNEENKNELWVGSQCIMSFEISVFEAGRLIAPDDVARHLERCLQARRLEICLRKLAQLAATEQAPNLNGALEYYRQHGVLTPKQANVVFWRLDEHQIDYSPTFFKICLRRKQHQHDLRVMHHKSVQRMWPALSLSQRQMAIAFGHRAPPQMLNM